MKKLSLTTLFLLLMLVSLVGTAAAAPRSSRTITLLSVDYVPGKGPVFTFRVSGHFSRAELKGFVHVEGGEDYDLYCNQVDETTVKCTTSKKAGGTNVALTWGGSTFWTSVPAAPEFCYSIWDWWDFTDYEWADFGPYCQETPANAFDIISYDVPHPDGSFESFAVFYDVDVADYCSSPVPYNGPAYYYPGCPEYINE